MEDKLDRILAKLATAPTHPGLMDLDAAVLRRIARNPAMRRTSGALAVATALAAVVMGVAGAALPAASAQAQPFLSPLGPAYPLAPSTLLGDDY